MTICMSARLPHRKAHQLTWRNIAQVLGIILSLSVSGSIFQNEAILKLTAALPNASVQQVSQLITGASGSFYNSLPEDERALVVVQVTEAIRDSFYYLVVVTAVGFISCLFLSVGLLFIAIPSALNSDLVLTLSVCSQRKKLFLEGGAVAS
jgi:hypothetical protein